MSEKVVLAARRSEANAAADRPRDRREEPGRGALGDRRDPHPRRAARPPPPRLIGELGGAELPIGDIDITFYRDDVGAKAPTSQPVVHDSHIDFDLAGRTVVLVDDVLFTGRTVRAAIDALFDYGRPERVQLAVLCDRGHRELPIRPDYVGKNLPTAREERVNVRLEEIDGIDQVTISEPQAAEAPA